MLIALISWNADAASASVRHDTSRRLRDLRFTPWLRRPFAEASLLLRRCWRQRNFCNAFPSPTPTPRPPARHFELTDTARQGRRPRERPLVGFAPVAPALLSFSSALDARRPTSRRPGCARGRGRRSTSSSTCGCARASHFSTRATAAPPTRRSRRRRPCIVRRSSGSASGRRGRRIARISSIIGRKPAHGYVVTVTEETPSEEGRWSRVHIRVHGLYSALQDGSRRIEESEGGHAHALSARRRLRAHASSAAG